MRRLGGGRVRAPSGATAIAVICAALVAGCSGDRATGPSSAPQTELSFCPGNVPIWFAYQDAGGRWTQATPDASGVISAALPQRAAIAFVDTDSAGFGHLLQVEYASPSELAVQFQCKAAPTSNKALVGSVVGLDSSEAALVSLGSAAVWLRPTDSVYTLDGVQDGALDLVALGTSDSYSAPAQIAIRRSVNLGDGARSPLLDFGSSEAAAAATATLTIGGVNGDLVTGRVDFTTAAGTSSPVMGIATFEPTLTYGGVPNALLAPGDLHSIALQTPDRSLVSWFHAIANRTMTLGPNLESPVTSVAAAAPYVRPRLQLRVQPEYSSVLAADWFEQYDGGAAGPVEVFAVVTSSYVHAGSGTWDFTVPDLTSAGFDTSWGLRAGAPVSLNLTAFGGASLAQILGTPKDGVTYRTASFNSTASRLSRSPTQAITLQRLFRFNGRAAAMLDALRK